MISDILHRLRALFRRKSVEAELDDELRAHLEQQAEKYVQSGLPRDEAMRRARVELGGVEQIKEECRDARGVNLIETTIQDLRYGLRMLAKNPGFTAMAVLTLGLGIGVNTTVFSVADGILFHPLPFVQDSNRVVGIVQISKDSDWHAVIEPANFKDLQKQCQSFSTMAGYEWTSPTLAGSPQTHGSETGAERVDAARVSKNFFETLASKPELGRIFLPEEQQPGHPVVILSDRLWRSHFASNPQILGQTIHLDGQSFAVIGVMPRRFDFPTGAALWMPLDLSPEEWANRKAGHLHVIARLRPGVTLSQARSELSAVSGRLAQDYPETNNGQTAVPVLVGELINGNLTPMFCYTLLGAVGFLLLIACVNVTNLQMARATNRWREVALRSALGAGRLRMVRQLLTETALLAVLGAGLGLAFAQGATRLIVSSMPAETAVQIAGWGDIGLKVRALGFAMAVTLLSALVAGLAPALRGSKIALNQALKSAGPTMAGYSLRLRGILVSAEVALALLLVVGAGLMVKGFRGILEKAEAFGPANLVTARVLLPEYKYPDFEKRRAYDDRVLESLQATPGVSAACLFTTPPFSNNGTRWRNFSVEGVPSGKRLPAAVIQAISGNYFQLMSIPVGSGRTFDARDSATALPVAIVSQKLARLSWPAGSALGKQLRLVQGDSAGPWLTVVGVAGDVEYDWTDNEPEKAIYIPYSQTWSSLDPKARDEWAGAYFGARTSVASQSLIPTLRRELASVDPDVPSFGWETLDKVMTDSLAGVAEVGGMMTGAGLMALILAAVGIYGVAAFNVEQRTREIGIRVALGATRADVLLLVLKRGSLLAAVGLAVGMAGALALMPLLSAFFYGVKPADPATLLSVSLLLAAVALVATYIPARRATKVDPMVALRYE